MPSAAIGLVPEVPGTVLDPFCGAGTTLVEAVRLGRDAIGVDLNPIATLITRTKLARWQPEDDGLLDRYLADLRWAAMSVSDADLEAARQRIPRIDHWFLPVAQRVLAGATRLVASVSEERWRDRIATAISASVVRLSRQDSDTRYAAVDKPIEMESALRVLERSLTKVGEQLRAFGFEHSGSSVRVEDGDAVAAVERLERGSIAAAVFSPPYPNAYEYWLYHKYRMYWLGYDPVAVRSGEWGARPHYSGGGKSTIDTFRGQMAPVMFGLADALAPDGICLVVVGDSKIKGVIHDNGDLFEELAVNAGLIVVGRAERTIRQASKAFNLTNSRAKTEHVLLFARP
jgi:site-specific DNA-methyltransferase (cytosine-N4-specific)